MATLFLGTQHYFYACVADLNYLKDIIGYIFYYFLPDILYSTFKKLYYFSEWFNLPVANLDFVNSAYSCLPKTIDCVLSEEIRNVLCSTGMWLFLHSDSKSEMFFTIVPIVLSWYLL